MTVGFFVAYINHSTQVTPQRHQPEFNFLFSFVILHGVNDLHPAGQ